MDNTITEIKFEDIKLADTIEVTQILSKGTVIIIKGVVDAIYPTRIYSDETLLVQGIHPTSSRTILLLERPKLPFRTGELINAVLTSGKEEILVRVERCGDDDEMLWMALSGTGGEYYTEAEIESWKLLKLVDA